MGKYLDLQSLRLFQIAIFREPLKHVSQEEIQLLHNPRQ